MKCFESIIASKMFYCIYRAEISSNARKAFCKHHFPSTLEKQVNKIPKQVSKIYSFPEKLFKFYEIKFSGP